MLNRMGKIPKFKKVMDSLKKSKTALPEGIKRIKPALSKGITRSKPTMPKGITRKKAVPKG